MVSAERRHFEQALLENKWYLSERAGYDVGMVAAKRDFLEHHFERVARQFRRWFCGETCRLRATCELAIPWRASPRTGGNGG